MATFQYRKEQLLTAELKEIWDFIATPQNLGKITPDQMNFEITNVIPDRMYSGQIITYRVSPMPFYRTTWVTEITHIEEGKFFVDEQRDGPYKMWHHEHHIEQTELGILMTDIITYTPPFGILGKIANGLFIRKQIDKIFDYRSKVLEQAFPKE